MRQKRFKIEEIIKILRESEGSLSNAEISRMHNISEQTLYRWKRKYSGMELSDAKRLKSLEEENTRLKKKVADLVLTVDILKEVNSKKW